MMKRANVRNPKVSSSHTARDSFRFTVSLSVDLRKCRMSAHIADATKAKMASASQNACVPALSVAMSTDRSLDVEPPIWVHRL